MKAKKLVLAVLAMATAVSLFAGCGGGGGDKKSGGGEKKFINIATGGTSGTYYPGRCPGRHPEQERERGQCSAQSTGASVANVNLLKEGKVDIAFVQNDISYYAVKGLEMFKGKKKSRT